MKKKLNGWKNTKTKMVVVVLRSDKIAYLNALGKGVDSLKLLMTRSFNRAKIDGETNPLSPMAAKYKSLWGVDWPAIAHEFTRTNEAVLFEACGHVGLGDDDCQQCLIHGPANRVVNF